MRRGEIDLEAGLGVAEVVRAETGLRIFAEERGEDVVEERLQVADGDVFIDVETLELVEVGGVRGVGGVAAIHAAGRDDADGRLALEHRADLHGRGVRAEEIFFLGIFFRDVGELGGLGEIERVLGVARGVVGGGVEGVEAVILGFDLGAVGDSEADFAQDAAHLFADERERVIGAGADVGGRERSVDGGAELGLKFGGFDLRERGIKQRLEAGFGFVDELAERGALLLRDGAHLFHQRGEFTVGADVAGLGGFEFGARFQRGEFGGGFREDGGELILHGRASEN